MNKLLIICGPTGVGKTKLGIVLAKTYNGEIISADSRQIYKGMDIGTGKDKKSFQSVPVWMIDVVRPDEEYSVSLYQKHARIMIEALWNRGKLPIVVGGTGLFIQSLVETIPTVDVKPNTKLRKDLNSFSLPQLQSILKKEYLPIWKTLNYSDQNNPRRLIRKIELGMQGVYASPRPTPFIQDVCWIGLYTDYSSLYARIDNRVDERIAQGVKQEVMQLRKQGYDWNLQSMSGIGYSEWKLYEEGKVSIDEVIIKWKYNEHAYARRQMTWFKKNKAIRWFSISDPLYQMKIEEVVRTWYTTPTYDIKNRNII